MSSGLPQGTYLQRQILRLYGELLARESSLSSKLVFASGAQASGSGLPAAVSIAGGTSLIVDPDTSAVKAVLRQGGVDFVVNTLDEALRVLKNEIRKHTPLSVVLISAVEPVIAEMAERGVVPDIHVQMIEDTPALSAPTASHGIHLCSGEEGLELSEVARLWLEAHGWSEQLLHADSIAAQRTLDVQLIELLPADDTVRLQWLRRITHYQRPMAGAGRIAWLTAQELVSIREPNS